MAEPLPAIKDVAEETILARLQAWRERPFRLKQLREWLYGERFAVSFGEMANLPAALRERLGDPAAIRRSGPFWRRKRRFHTCGIKIFILFVLAVSSLFLIIGI